MRTVLALVALALATLLAPAGPVPGPRHARAATLSIEVTSTADAAPPGGPLCPHADRCTLREAIETVNADESGGPYTITFGDDAFPAGAPGVVLVGLTPLPPITQDNVTIDASTAGVRIIDANPSLTGANNGLVSSGEANVVRGLAVEGFAATCILVTGANSTVGGDSVLKQGNRLANCTTGIAVRGISSMVSGNRVGFSAEGDAAPVEIAIAVAASNVLVGRDSGSDGLANYVGNAATGVLVGDDVAAPFSGVRVLGNGIGRDADGTPAPVTRGVDLSQPGTSTTVANNDIANAGTGIAVRPNTGALSVSGNRLEGNTFSAITGMAIDLGTDGLRNANDAGDADAGANGLRNHAVILRAVQSSLTGSAPDCAGCRVEVYLANHTPGGANDYGATPIAAALATTDASGNFSFVNPPVAPGQWVIALVTDPAGNTSEFGPSSRVGAGAVQCGNITLVPGWNHVGYFGPEPVALGETFPADPQGSITAIYRAEDGSTGFERWFKTASIGRNLSTVQPGEAYWFFAESAVTLPGGFSLAVPLPVQLKAGWNDFVYIGATVDVRDALASLAGNYEAAYTFRHDASGARWTRLGGQDTPGWAREAAVVEACGVYQVRLDSPVTFTPIQP